MLAMIILLIAIIRILILISQKFYENKHFISMFSYDLVPDAGCCFDSYFESEAQTGSRNNLACPDIEAIY